MPMTLEFNGTINGDNVSGSVTLGAFGSRAADNARARHDEMR
jgi:hypothetical protein